MDEAFVRNVQKNRQIQDEKRQARKKQGMPNPPLSSLALQLKRHWAEYLPKMTEELRANGSLHQQLEETPQTMRDQETGLLRQGVHPDQAREMTREIGFLPEEEPEAEQPA